jgi:cell division protein FtsL
MSVSVRIKNRRVIEQSRNRPMRLAGILVLLALVTFAALFYSFARMRTLNISYQSSRALEEQREMREEARRLRVELNHLRSPAKLERQAEEMGLIQAKPEQIRRLK